MLDRAPTRERAPVGQETADMTTGQPPTERPEQRAASRRKSATGRRAGVRTTLQLVAGIVVLAGLLIGVGQLIVHIWQPSGAGHREADISRWFEKHRSSGWTRVSLVVYAADTITITFLTAASAVAMRLIFRRWRESVFLISCVVGEALTFTAVSTFVDRHRPPVQHLDASPPTSSFPSGHTAAAVAFYGGLALVLSTRLRRPVSRALWVLAGLVAVAVALGRLYRGMHFVTDLVGGAVLGAIWLTYVYNLWQRSAAPLGKAPARTATATTGRA
jgi:membrane-associated phospholipid phosphatase